MKHLALIVVLAGLIPGYCAEGELTIAAVGDIRLNGYIGGKIKQYGFAYPFEQVSDLIRTADITYGNLECALTGMKEPVTKKYVFRGEPSMITALVEAGFDILDVANNHSGDYGIAGFIDTLNIIGNTRMKTVGGGENLAQARMPVVVKRNGLTIAFLSYSNTFPRLFWAGDASPGVTPAYLEYITEDVRKARAEADLVVVCYHGGDERSDVPKQVQKDIAHAAVDAGAGLVLGHHPHILQGIEVYKGSPIVYSLGNFLFLSLDPRCYDTMVVRADVSAAGVISLKIHPVRIDDAFVRKAEPAEAARILETVRLLSADLGAVIAIEDDTGRLVMTDAAGNRQ